MRWRWGDVRLQQDGTVALCDATSCTASTDKVAVMGGDETTWYWFAAAMQNSNLGAGSRRVWLAKYNDPMPKSVDSTQSIGDMGGQSVIVGEGFKGLVDHLHIINRVATESDLVNYRVGTVAHSTPGVVFQSLCDDGRGEHVYAEQPFIAGSKAPSVKWVRSLAPLQWATLNSDIAPPLKV